MTMTVDGKRYRSQALLSLASEIIPASYQNKLSIMVLLVMSVNSSTANSAAMASKS